jgi:hypothetical protein
VSEPRVTARFDFHAKAGEAPVINPGDWWGKAWLLEVSCGYDSDFFVVEADTVADAIDLLAEDEEHGHVIAIDVEVDGDDYAESIDGMELTEEQELALLRAMEEAGVADRSNMRITLKGKFVNDGTLSEPNMSGQGIWYDSDHLLVHGQEGRELPYKMTYHGPGLPEEGVSPLEYGNKWDWDDQAEQFFPICPDCNTRLREVGLCPECSDDE